MCNFKCFSFISPLDASKLQLSSISRCVQNHSYLHDLMFDFLGASKWGMRFLANFDKSEV